MATNEELEDLILKDVHKWITKEISFEVLVQNRNNSSNQNLFNRTVLCALLSEDIFFAIKDNGGSNDTWKSHEFVNSSSFTIAFKNSLTLLTNSLMNKLDSSDHSWQWTQNFCIILQCILELFPINYEQRIDDLGSNIDIIIKYFHKLLSKCYDLKTVTLVISVLIKFSTSKIQSLIEHATNTISPYNIQQDGTNFCRLIDALVKRRPNILHYEATVDVIVEYLLKVLNEYSRNIESSHLRTMLMAILSVENLFLRICDVEMQEKILKTIVNSEFTKEWEKLNFKVFNRKTNYLPYQIKFCINWHIDEIKLNSSIANVPVLKISKDQFSARNDNLKFSFPTVLSAFATRRNVFYYEVLLLTDGEMRFGWSTEQAKLNKDDAIGNDIYSIGLDVSQMGLYHNINMNKGKPFCEVAFEQNQHSASEILPTNGKIGDIVGCLIDVNQKRFRFFLNGHEIKYDLEVKFDENGPYYAAASLAAKQHCYFNFGQLEFKHPPSNDVNNFCDFVNGDIRKYGLVTTKEIDCQFWFEKQVYDDQIIPFYQTPGEMVPLLDNVRNLISKIDEIGDENKCMKIIQEIIELFKIDTLKIEQTVASISELFFKIHPKIAKAKLYQLFYPYLQMNVDQSDAQKHLKISVFLVNMIEIFKTIDPIRVGVFAYLFKTFTNINDSWTELYALIGLDHLKFSSDEEMKLNKSVKLQQKSKAFNHFKIHEEIEKEEFKRNSSIVYQVLFCSHYLQDIRLSRTKLDFDSQENKAAFSREDRTEHLKLSYDLLSVRSDSKWQSVRSVCKVKKDIWYYEVTLITGGPMRIGWSANRIFPDVLGKDHFSVTFDGFNKCLWHRGKQYPLGENARWKAGDTVGCLMDKTGQKTKSNDEMDNKFIFTLNGQKLVLPTDIHCSTLSHGAAISLTHRQQVHCNFGQSPFKHVVDLIDYRNFNDLADEMKEAESAKINFIVSGSVDTSTIILNSSTKDVNFNSREKLNQLNHSSPTNLNYFTQPIQKNIGSIGNGYQPQTSSINSGQELKFCNFCGKRACEEWAVVCEDCTQKRRMLAADASSVAPEEDKAQIKRIKHNDSEEQ